MAADRPKGVSYFQNYFSFIRGVQIRVEVDGFRVKAKWAYVQGDGFGLGRWFGS